MKVKKYAVSYHHHRPVHSDRKSFAMDKKMQKLQRLPSLFVEGHKIIKLKNLVKELTGEQKGLMCFKQNFLHTIKQVK